MNRGRSCLTRKGKTYKRLFKAGCREARETTLTECWEYLDQMEICRVEDDPWADGFTARIFAIMKAAGIPVEGLSHSLSRSSHSSLNHGQGLPGSPSPAPAGIPSHE